jgi:hypothetical protein
MEGAAGVAGHAEPQKDDESIPKLEKRCSHYLAMRRGGVTC